MAYNNNSNIIIGLVTETQNRDSCFILSAIAVIFRSVHARARAREPVQIILCERIYYYNKNTIYRALLYGTIIICYYYYACSHNINTLLIIIHFVMAVF